GCSPAVIHLSLPCQPPEGQGLREGHDGASFSETAFPGQTARITTFASTRSSTGRSCNLYLTSKRPLLCIRALRAAKSGGPESTHCCRFPRDNGWTAVDPKQSFEFCSARAHRPIASLWPSAAGSASADYTGFFLLPDTLAD